jgi:S1-C subfamily serine protease
VQKARASVVEIFHSSGLGSGIVCDVKGNIVTNAPVVGNATQFNVTFAAAIPPMTSPSSSAASRAS